MGEVVNLIPRAIIPRPTYGARHELAEIPDSAVVPDYRGRGRFTNDPRRETRLERFERALPLITVACTCTAVWAFVSLADLAVRWISLLTAGPPGLR